MDEQGSVLSAIGDLSARVARLEVPDRVQRVGASATPTGYRWRSEMLDVGGTAGAVLPASAGDWSTYFDFPSVTKYLFDLPTDSGDFFAQPMRGLEGEYRWTLSFVSDVPCTVSAMFTYYTDSVSAKVQLVVNGTIVHNADFAGSTIIGELVSMKIQAGPNRISIGGDIYCDEIALYTGGMLSRGFTKPL